MEYEKSLKERREAEQQRLIDRRNLINKDVEPVRNIVKEKLKPIEPEQEEKTIFDITNHEEVLDRVNRRITESVDDDTNHRKSPFGAVISIFTSVMSMSVFFVVVTRLFEVSFEQLSESSQAINSTSEPLVFDAMSSVIELFPFAPLIIVGGGVVLLMMLINASSRFND